MNDQMHALPQVLRAAEINRDHFQYHLPAIERAFGGGITGRATGRGSGTGSPRMVTPEAAAGLAIGFRLIAQGIAPTDAFRVGLSFVFCGEDGAGHRGIAPPEWIVRRTPGREFDAMHGDTFAVVIPAALRSGIGREVAFAPRSILTGQAIADLAAEANADREPALILNISEVLRGLRDGLAESVA
ncbi:hypothetical protein E4L95_15275 [Paracoccus liaowanqingii]|uniref:Uncharacterized protein n=1 Tax=Paracoccus liaowanqingii TaxID=2560053 RepID=A0A4Z1CEY6_9RHOB|nr:hypothetical protein [Paracoccus liaowanqingii]TGN54895.1 hypothetical protein E4L95_15275 [Paracoccus liaowanqingii]